MKKRKKNERVVGHLPFPSFLQEEEGDSPSKEVIYLAFLSSLFASDSPLPAETEEQNMKDGSACIRIDPYQPSI